jgi:hypothetical protein
MFSEFTNTVMQEMEDQLQVTLFKSVSQQLLPPQLLLEQKLREKSVSHETVISKLQDHVWT